MSLVQIPPLVRAAAAALGGTGVDASTELSRTYRDQPGRAVTLTHLGKRAYLAARWPATYAATVRALERYRDAGGIAPESVLDVGSGPGTASLAATAVFPDLSCVTRNDVDGSWRAIADVLGAASGHPGLQGARWITGPMSGKAFPAHDLVVAAYSLNEVPESDRSAAIASLWTAAGQAVVLVEPGTPQGFENLYHARVQLLDLGAHIAAPCPHHGTCPMSIQDWCHSAVRLARDVQHRTAKGGTLSYEDEKFTYLCATRAPATARPMARIVKKPAIHSGHVRLDMCSDRGLTRETISRRAGAHYKAARKADWGDGWPPDQDP